MGVFKFCKTPMAQLVASENEQLMKHHKRTFHHSRIFSKIHVTGRLFGQKYSTNLSSAFVDIYKVGRTCFSVSLNDGSRSDLIALASLNFSQNRVCTSYPFVWHSTMKRRRFLHHRIGFSRSIDGDRSGWLDHVWIGCLSRYHLSGEFSRNHMRFSWLKNNGI